jgi:ribosomal protein L37AE/L43A
MNKKKCEVCGSSHTVKNGVRKGVQLYKCQDCGHQFRAGVVVSEDELWEAYQQEKQTIKELSERYGKSVATIKRRLHDIKREWVQPSLSGEGFMHLDVTYWGRNFGVLLALDDQTGKPLYIAFVKSETVKDYEDAASSVKGRGYTIRGLIIDGKQSLFKKFSEYHIQMCQFHMKQIIRRYLTLNPKMHASKELKALVDKLHKANEADFKKDYQEWKEKWKHTIGHKSLHKDGKMHYTHQRLRAAMNSLNFYLPYLFTYQREDCKGMPNTNNKIEGTFTDLKKNLNNHSGLTKENRKRFISGFFLALAESLSMEKQEPR